MRLRENKILRHLFEGVQFAAIAIVIDVFLREKQLQ